MADTNTLPNLNISVEQTPKKIEKTGVSEVLLTNADYITVTHLPKSRLKNTTKAVKTLVDRDKVSPTRIIPHIGARNISSKAGLTRHLKNLKAIGINNVLLVGGSTRDSDDLPFHEDDDLFSPVKSQGFNFVYCGVYPYKYSPSYYGYLKYDVKYTGGISQLCLSPRRLRQYPDTRIGVPSKADFRGLYRYMKLCGVGPSLRYPFRDLGGLFHYMTYDGFATSRFVEKMSSTHTDIHLYDFGRMEETIEELIENSE